ncbi:MAG: tRNA (guanosine(37)-N1)-methyltransferase TrmD, partial [Deltaproteobacteria bacterium]|nr:tRNA (guanosine(37)-N1)-methyltransferase TrmD [Deltaproteobacteria bacterium]
DVSTRNIRDYATDKHKTTDDTPYGGGHGMVMKAEPIVAAIEAAKEGMPRATVILTTPQGERLTQTLVSELSRLPGLIIVCGRYEGYDERIRAFADREISIGDYVLSGGEIPALAIIDSVARLIPGVLGEIASSEADSFSAGLLEYPQYTRPEEFRGMRVPEVLLSGNHANIEKWRRRESIRRTLLKRPDLIALAGLTDKELGALEEIKAGKNTE